MPGMLGTIKLNGAKVDRNIHQLMLSKLLHRHHYHTKEISDRGGNYIFTSISLGVAKNEFLTYTDRHSNVTVGIEGELYRDNEMGLTDAECILQSYLKNGMGFAHSLEGSFIILIIDKIKKTILLANDHMGSRPIFWCRFDSNLYIAPEPKAFFEIPGFCSRIDEEGIVGFLSGGRLVSNKGYIRNIERLKNGSILQIAEKEIFVRPYWVHKIRTRPGKSLGRLEYATKLADLLIQATRKRVSNKKNVGMLLSGGIDSRLVFASFIKAFPERKILTISYGIDENVDNSDALIASEISKKLEMPHAFVRIHPERLINNFHEIVYLSDALHDEPGNYADSLDVYKQIKEKLKVDYLLRGDEPLGGSLYSVVTETDLLGRVDFCFIEKTPFYKKVLNNELLPVLSNISSKIGKAMLYSYRLGKIPDWADNIYFGERLFSRMSVFNYLKQIEVEMINPLVDRGVIEFLYSVPIKFRRNRRIYFNALKVLSPELSEFPYSTVESDPDWRTEFSKNKELQKFVFDLLINEHNPFDQYLQKNELEKYLLNIFNQQVERKKAKRVPKIFTLIKERLKSISVIVLLSHKIRGAWEIPEEQLIFRLMVMKSFFKQFKLGPKVLCNRGTPK